MQLKIDSSHKKYDWLLHSFTVLLFFCALYTLFFFPVLFSDKLLAPGDGITYYAPNFYSPRTLWTSLILSGYPVAADPQTQTWYPLSGILSFIPDSWNAFVLSAFILASCFSYGYVYTLTRSRLAALVSGTVYGMCGFMMAHLGHASIIHAAVWIPLLIWALEKLRYPFNGRWLVVGAFAVACSFLAGHPQIFVYGMSLGAIYAFVFGWLAPIGRWKYYGLSLAVVVFGIALTALQLIPTMELAGLSLRSAMSFGEFVSHSLPLGQAVQLLFPYLFGGLDVSFYKLPYFGEWSPTEITGYSGLLPLMLAAIGFFTYWDKSVKYFWLGVALFALLLTLGDATPLAQLMYHLPVYNKFRVPARHFIEVSLAVSVLAGLGIATLQKQLASNRLLLKTVLVSTGGLLVSVLGIFIFSNQLQKKAIAAGIEHLSLLPWSNPAVGVPLVIFGLAVTTLIYWSKSPESKFRGLGLLLILVLDLGSFGWFYGWQDYAASKSLLTPTISTQRYKNVLNASQQRMLPLRGGDLGTADEIPPNISRVWGVPSASGYGPLILSRYSQLLSMAPAGQVLESLLDSSDRSLNIMSARYVFLPKSYVDSIGGTSNGALDLLSKDLNVTLGSACGIQRFNSIKLQVPAQLNVSNLSIVSSLGCSAGVSDEEEVLRLSVTDADGKIVTQSLHAGRDTAEWAYDCSDVLPLMQHRKAPIFKSFPIERESFPSCEGHNYISTFPLEKLSEVKSIELEEVTPSATVTIHNLSLTNEKTKQSYPITAISTSLTDKMRWRHVEDINEISVYENQQAMPRAWLVPEVAIAKPNDILNSIKLSQLPDGRTYEPSKVAFVEEPVEFATQKIDPSATAKVVNLSDTRVEVKTSSASPAFLVLSDVYYPGWQATVNGKSARIFQTNYILRGVLVPAGEHVVRFEFKPISFRIGAGISAATLFLLGYLFWKLSPKPHHLVKHHELSLTTKE